jgi:hypothetical protein
MSEQVGEQSVEGYPSKRGGKRAAAAEIRESKRERDKQACRERAAARVAATFAMGAKVEQLLASGRTISQVAADLGVTRGVVSGHYHRLGIRRMDTRLVKRAVRETTVRTPKVRTGRHVVIKPFPIEPEGFDDVNLSVLERPLPGTHPVVLRDRRGCAFPLCGQGADMLFCDDTRRLGSDYCDTHHAIAYRRRKIRAHTDHVPRSS